MLLAVYPSAPEAGVALLQDMALRPRQERLAYYKAACSLNKVALLRIVSSDVTPGFNSANNHFQ